MLNFYPPRLHPKKLLAPIISGRIIMEKERKEQERKQGKNKEQEEQKEQKQKKPVIRESWGDFMRKVLG
jgi:hypothetical protein